MSAYICEGATIDAIISTLHHGRSRGEPCRTYGGQPFTKLGYDLTQELDCKRLAFDLHRLNCLAVDARYSETNEANYSPRIAPGNARSLIATYKSCQCLRYQCSEGDVPKMPLYQALEDFKSWLAEEITESLPEYQAARWA